MTIAPADRDDVLDVLRDSPELEAALVARRDHVAATVDHLAAQLEALTGARAIEAGQDAGLLAEADRRLAEYRAQGQRLGAELDVVRRAVADRRGAFDRARATIEAELSAAHLEARRLGNQE